jgi:hypothetical protein
MPISSHWVSTAALDLPSHPTDNTGLRYHQRINPQHPTILPLHRMNPRPPPPAHASARTAASTPPPPWHGSRSYPPAWWRWRRGWCASSYVFRSPPWHDARAGRLSDHGCHRPSRSSSAS